MRKLLILGATGSIGTTCLSYLKDNKDLVNVVGLVSKNNEEKIRELSFKFNAPYLLTRDDPSSLSSFIDQTKPDIVLNGISGFSGLYASLLTLERGIDLALANKESIVTGSSFIFDEAKKNNAKIIPVDSEHSAIYNLLKERKAKSLIITASGGPFFDRYDLSNVKVEDALVHPTWKMGKKITIDSSTLANKGLEVIEASYLFGFDKENIEVTIHRQSIIHSMIRTEEGSVYAQLSPPDMTLPIISAITDTAYPLSDVVKPLSFKNLTLSFSEPDYKRFPLLKYAYDALSFKYTGPILYNASNECAVSAFLEERISYLDIEKIVYSVLSSPLSSSPIPTNYKDVEKLDREARKEAERIIKEIEN